MKKWFLVLLVALPTVLLLNSCHRTRSAAPVTWFVRPDGGTRYSAYVPTGLCDGTGDTAPVGTTPNQHCAFSDVRSLFMTGAYGNQAWVIAGGDTVVIRGCAAAPTQVNPDNPHCRVGWDDGARATSWCKGVGTYSCGIPPPPSGTAENHTRILGGCAFGTYTCNPVNVYPYTSNNLTQLFAGWGGGGLLFLSGSNFVDIVGLELTTHNGVCSLLGAPAYPKPCANSQPYDDSAKWGIITDATSTNITMQDVYIHGFSNVGISGPVGGTWNMTRTSIDFNGFAGWNFDDGKSTPDAPGTKILQSYMTMIGNGCIEQYPIQNPQFPALACWDTTTGGFGDSWSGQQSPLDTFTCDHCNIGDNTKDAALGPHTVLTHLSLTNSAFYGNMGQQGKWGMAPASDATITNNTIVGNCNRMSQILPGAAQNFAKSSGLGGSYLSGFCRAAGDVFAFFNQSNSTMVFKNNSVTAYSATIFDLSCTTGQTAPCAPLIFSNNIFLGYQQVTGAMPGGNGQLPGLYWLNGGVGVSVSSNQNDEYNVRNGTCPTAPNGTICTNPAFVNQPTGQNATFNEAQLDAFNFNLTPGSPAIAINAGAIPYTPVVPSTIPVTVMHGPQTCQYNPTDATVHCPGDSKR